FFGLLRGPLQVTPGIPILLQPQKIEIWTTMMYTFAAVPRIFHYTSIILANHHMSSYPSAVVFSMFGVRLRYRLHAASSLLNCLILKANWSTTIKLVTL